MTGDGHIEDVNVCRFFPSGVVVLSGGSDFKLKVWSAEDGSCPVTIAAHGYGVSDVCMVDRGRNVISVGRDGACKLFDVGGAGLNKCLATLAQCGSIVNACDIRTLTLTSGDQKFFVSEMNEQPTENASEREVGTENKLIACAYEDGYLRVVAVRSRKIVRIIRIFLLPLKVKGIYE